MSDIKEKIQAKLSEKQLIVLSTINEDGKPWVRYVMGVPGENLELRVATFAPSRKVAQIKANPEVHVVYGVTGLESTESYLQIQGRAEVNEDPAEKQALWNDGLKAYFKGPDDPNMVIVIIRPYRIELQSMTSMQPEIWEAQD